MTMPQLLNGLRKKYSWLHIGYLWLVGLAGWITLLYIIFSKGLSANYNEAEAQVLVTTIITALMCRALTFNVYDKVRISIDTGYYVAVSFILGPTVSSLIAACALTVESTCRIIHEDLSVCTVERKPLSYKIGQIIFNGGVPVISLLVGASIFKINGSLDDIIASYGGTLTFVGLATRLVGLTCTCLLIHYFIASIASLVQGRTLSGVFMRFYMGVLSYEITMIPISLALLLGYISQGFGFFLVLTASYLVCNFLCRKLGDQNITIQQRAVEMLTLNDVSQRISAKLNLDELMLVVAEYSQRIVRRTPSRFVMGLIDEQNPGTVEYTLFSEVDGQPVKHRKLPFGEGLSGRVMTSMKPIMLSDAPMQALDYQVPQQYIEPRFHSWIGIPLVNYDESIGLICLQTEQRNAYNEDILRALSTIARQTAIAVQNARLYNLATKDGLSKLYVRRYFDQRLTEEWSRARRYKHPLALLILDLDDFKMLNDENGHQAGDKVIRRVGEIILSSLRADDIPARYGGEEFGIILPNTGLDAANIVAKRIVGAVAKTIIGHENITMKITCSIGVAAFPDNEPQSSGDLLSMADQALYQAKAAGKNCSVMFSKATAVLADGDDAKSALATESVPSESNN